MKCKNPKIHYGGLERTLFSEEELVQPEGLCFHMHDEMVGKTDHGERKFLVFYFDDDEDYNVVLDKLGVKKSRVRSHPDMDSKQLAKILRELWWVEKGEKSQTVPKAVAKESELKKCAE